MDDLTRIQPKFNRSLALRAQKNGEVYALKGEILVGREVECDIQLASPQISRYHAKLTVSANGVFVEDLQSSNGTFVNGRQIRSRTLISIGDQVCFDDLEFRVTSGQAGDADSTRIANSQEFTPEQVAAMNLASQPLPADLDQLNQQVQANRQPEGSPQVNAELAQTHRSAPHAQSQIAPEGDPGKQPKVHQMPDIDEFLAFAGSGLKAQEMPEDHANPFQLIREKSGPMVDPKASELEPLDTDQTTPPDSRGTPREHRLTEEERAYYESTQLNPLELPDDHHFEPRQAPPASRVPPAPVSPAAPVPPLSGEQPAVPDAYAHPPKPTTPYVHPNMPEPVTEFDEEEDDETRFVSLNTMDRYVDTNQKFFTDIDAGSGPRLIAMTAPIRGKVFQLESSDSVFSWSLGRDDSVDICIRDKAVSREHAWITKLDSFYQLRVNDSANSILINGETATEVDLHHGDRLQFGTMELVFRLDVKPKPETPEPEPKVSWFEGLIASVKSLWQKNHS